MFALSGDKRKRSIDSLEMIFGSQYARHCKTHLSTQVRTEAKLQCSNCGAAILPACSQLRELL